MRIIEAKQRLQVGAKEITIQTTSTLEQAIALQQESGHVFILVGVSYRLDSGATELHFKPGNGVDFIQKQYEITEADTLLEDA